MLGNGPRIAPLAVDQISPDLLALVEPMAAVNATLDSRDQGGLTRVLTDKLDAGVTDVRADVAALPEIIRTMLRHPDLFAQQITVGLGLIARGKLSPRDRELAILRVAWLCGAPYEWGEHVIVARKVGVTAEDVERITAGPDAPDWSRHDAALIRACDELRDHAMIGDATWAVLAERYDDRQLIELPVLIGQYQLVAYYQNSLRLRLHEGNAGLAAR